MNKSLLLAFLGVALLSAATTYLLVTSNSSFKDETTAILAYKQWKREYGIKQSSEEEDIYRQAVFVANYFMIQDHNSDNTQTYKMAINAFAALTEDEFRSTYLIDLSNMEVPETVFVPEVSATASTLNWSTQGVLPAVKNQGSCGSCWAFSAVALLESTNVIYKKATLTSFSEQQLVDCVSKTTYNCDGCSGGWPSGAVNYTIAKGIATEASYPYKGVSGTCKSFTSVFKPTAEKAVTASNAGFLAALNVQPISIAVDASTWSYYSSGTFSNCSSKASAADHAVLLVGYDANGNWIVRNSWGTSWGNKGYITLASGNTCGIYNYGVVASA